MLFRSSASGYVSDKTDCDDGNKNVHPGAAEICDVNDVDEDCNGLADDADPYVSGSGSSTWYLDADGDGYGLATSSRNACDTLTGYAQNANDCDDSSAAINPAAQEICDANNTDEDCDGVSDDDDRSTAAAGKTTYYKDADADAYGNAAKTTKEIGRAHV